MPASYIQQRVHLVWATKHHRPWLDSAWRPRLFAYINGIARHQGAALLCAGGARDHIHLYLEYPATIALASLVNAIKSNSSRWIHQTFPHRRDFHWQDGYAAFSVDPTRDDKLQDYIRNQETLHRERDFTAEYLALLDQHAIDYDVRHVLN